MNDQEILRLWYLALNSDFGIAVVTTDRDRFRQILYAARKSSGDDALARLSVETVPDEPSLLFITKRVSIDDIEVD